MTPWEIAMEIPSAHGLASDTFAHLCGGPGGYCLSSPEFFLLAREVELSERTRFAMSVYRHDMIAVLDYLANPFHRFPHEECNAWCIGVLAGDMVAAYRALVAVGGEREFICWQDRGNGYRWRRTGPSFNKFLSSLQRHGTSQSTRIVRGEENSSHNETARGADAADSETRVRTASPCLA